ncbi:MAG TPA: ZIP family metal transporter [Patescibacteria group bacterium]|nr:ZIP family metal transporter [Patescibacteria group bacterium]
MNQLVAILLLSTLGSILGLVGGIIFLATKGLAIKLRRYAVPFAAGVILSATFLELIPESVEAIGEKSFVYILFAFLGSFLFEQYFATMHHHEGRISSLNNSIPLVLFGDTIHNFIDGVTIASAYLTNPFFGLTVALATFLHEVPHEIGDFGILLSAGWKKSHALLANLFSAFATFVGSVVVYLFLRDFKDVIGVLISISAGIFLFLGATDFLPEVGSVANRKNNRKEILVVILGVLAIFFLIRLTS